jgi:CheY-like chemotaxis protein
VGIAARDIEKLFAPFERLGAERRAIDGTGLGLALSKGLIEAMGASITVSSTPGIGSTFTIELAGVPAPRSEHGHEAAHARPRPAGVVDAQPRLKVLYIEDNVSNLRLVERVLEHHAAVEMLPAMQGSLGLALAREHHPDIIVLDLQLPDIDGEVVLRRLKADPSTRDIPVVVLTADASRGLAERLGAIGSCEFLSKPLDVPHLLAVIETHIGSAGRRNASCDD